jgi:hypothetical protein
LNEDEIRSLNRIVTMYLDYGEEQAGRRTPLYMRDWREKLDEYDQFQRRRLAEEAARSDEFEEVARHIGEERM